MVEKLPAHPLHLTQCVGMHFGWVWYASDNFSYLVTPKLLQHFLVFLPRAGPYVTNRN
jgi:hypothetical protein